MTPPLKNRTPQSKLGLTPEASPDDVKRAHRELVNFLESAPDGVRRWAQGEIRAANDAYAAISNPRRARRARRASPQRRALAAIATLAVVVGVVVGVYNLGGGSSEAGPQGGGAAEGPSLSPGDQVRVSQLMRKLQAKPRDVATLVQLGNIFFQAGDYNAAGSWMKRAVVIEPGNVRARLALGASEFNIRDAADARRDWLRVIAEDPKNVEAYYDLGFLYVSKSPPDMANARKMWGKVVSLDPGSSVAKTVATHLEGLEKAASAGATSAHGEG